MTALFAELMTLDVLHRLGHVSDPSLRATSTELTMIAGSPAMNAIITYAALCMASRVVSDPEDETGTAPDIPADSEEAPILLTALGEGPVLTFLATDLVTVGVRVAGATALVSSPASREPAVPSIIEHPSDRMAASTNARLDADAECAATDLSERADAALIDEHNPAPTHAALTLGVPEVDGEDPSAPFETHPPHPRILDGGSWREWLTPLLDFVDVTVVSEDFASLLMARPDGAQVAEFLRGFDTTRAVRMRKNRTVQYWWSSTNGEISVEVVPDTSTLGAGDAFYGTFVWAIERDGNADPEHPTCFASSVVAVSVFSFGTGQWLTSRALAELVRGW